MKKQFFSKLSVLLIALVAFVCTLTACSKVEFKVDFVVDGAVYATINTNGNEVIKMPTDPQKEDYTFDGWFWDKDSWKKPFTANSLLDAPLSSNMSVYAKWSTIESVKGVQAEFADFQKTGDYEYSMKVANSVATLSLEPKVTINSRSNWSLSTDIYGNQTIASKTATLAVGNNTYYALVTADTGATQLYTLRIRRRAIYNVIFDTKGGTAVENQKVEEDTLATAPTTAKTGYDFTAWNYDFTNPITDNVIVVASWQAKQYTITYDAKGGDIESNTTNAIYDSDYTLATPSRRGYIFDGWYNGSEKVVDGKWQRTEDITIEARWNAEQYTITYNLDGGKIDADNPETYTVENGNITLNNPTKSGYTFIGWTGTDIETATLGVTILGNSIGNREYTANWTLDGFNITYHLNGGENHSSNPNSYSFESANIYLENPTRTGYLFNGWFTDEECTDEHKITVIASGTIGNIDLYAKWTPITYKIKFNKNASSATESMDAQDFTYDVSGNLAANSFVRVGYNFDGWTENADGSGTTYTNQASILNLTSVQSTEITLYAKWVAKNYTITLDRQGGAGGTESVEATFDCALPTATAPTDVDGFSFGGYYDEDGVLYYDSAMQSTRNWDKDADTTLYARWSGRTFTVTLDRQSGENGTASVAATFNSAMPRANAPTRRGYMFNGYFAQENGGGTQYYSGSMASLHVWDVSEASTIYAYWTANTYTIYFNTNNGTGTQSNVTATYDAAMPTITVTPTRTGYNFAGYFDATSNGIKYYNADLTSATTWDKTASTTLYAQWVGVNYAVHFDINNGTSGTMSNQAFVYGNSQTLSSNNYIRTGYAFAGWTRNQDGTGTVYSNNQTVNNLTTQENDTVVLYAKWTANSYVVTLNGFSTGNASYTISFNLNGASGVAPASQTVTTSRGLTYPAIPTRSGYIFGGWYTSSSCSGTPFDFSADVTANTTLYAKWVSYSGTGYFDYNGYRSVSVSSKSSSTAYYAFVPLVSGTVSIYTTGSLDTYGYLYNSSKNELTHDDDGSGNGYNFKITYSVTAGNLYYVRPCGYNSSGTTTVYISGNSPAASGKSQGITYETRNVTYDSAFRLPVVTREGYTFDGWYDGIRGTGTQYTDNGGQSILVWDKLADTTFYAKWTPVTYTISYELNGGYNNTNPTEFNIETNDITLTEPQKTGYTFGGWFANSNCSGSSVTSIPIGTIGNKIYYAKWDKVTYSITYHFANGTNNTSNPANYTIESSDVTLGEATREGYTFVNWYRNEDCTGDYVTTIANGSHGDIELWAKWQVNQYTISFETNGGTEVAEMTLDFGTQITYPTSQRNNYSFDGWYVDELGQTACTYETMPAQNMTLYAKWKTYAITITYDTNVNAISEFATIDAELFKATAVDTDGNPVDVTASIILGTQQAAGTVTIRLRAVGLYNKSAQVSIANVKVYGNPTLVYNTEKDYFNLSDTFNSALFNLSGVDSFGNATTTAISVSEQSYSAGDLVTVVLTSTDIVGNVVTVTVENVKVYGTPEIVYDTTKTAIKASDTIANTLFGVSATDSFGVALDCTTSIYSGRQTGGNTITIRVTTVDSKGNRAETRFDVKVYGLPVIADATKKDFRVEDMISVSSLGVVASDSFNEVLTNVTATLAEGEQEAGNTLTYLVIATDKLGNVNTRTISGIRIFGIPEITYNTQKVAMKATDTINAALFSAVAKNSFNEAISVTVTVKSGTQTGGTYMIFTLTATDHLGNTYSVDTAQIGVYDVNGIRLTYSALASDIMKINSCGEEFNARATDSFGVAIPVRVIVANGTLVSGQVVDIQFSTTDAAGNTKTGNTIRNITVFDLPRITYDREYVFIYPDEDLSVYIIGTDSTGEPLYVELDVVGTQTAGQILTVTATTADMAGNETVEVFTVPVVARTQSYIVFNANGGADMTGRYSIVSNGQTTYSLPVATREHYIFAGWYSVGNKQYTDGSGNSVTAWDSAVTTTLYAHWTPVTYTISYELNGGVQNANSRTQYHIESTTFTLLSPTKANYTFMGWYDNAELSGNKVTQVALGSFGNRTYYAKWEYGTEGLVYALNAGNYTVSGYKGTERDIRIPETFTGVRVTAIADSVFSGKNITRVDIPVSVQSIGNSTFSNCGYLTAVNFIGGSNLVTIGNYAFCNTAITSFSMASSVTSIGANAFSGVSTLETFTIGNGSKLQTIGESAFYGCSALTAFDMPSGVTSIGSFAFYYASSLTAITIPANVTILCDSTFSGASSLQTVTFASNSKLKTIESSVFSGCSALTSISIPSGVTSIGAAFNGTSSLQSITVPFIGATLNSNTNAYFGYIFGASSYSYNNSYVPSSLRTIVVTGGTSVLSNAFYGLNNVTSLVVPNSVTSIGSGAFKGCNSLTEITLPFVGRSRSVTSYMGSDSYAQYKFGYIFGYSYSNSSGTVYQDSSTYCYIPASLTRVTITDATGISARAFYNCTNLTSITINSGVTGIYGYAFYNCSALTSIYVPDGVTSIATCAFCNNSKLSSVRLPSGVTSIESYAFNGCSALTSIVLPSELTSIESYAFSGVPLTAINLPSKLQTIGDYAFQSNTAITTLTIPGNVKTIGVSAFSGATNVTSLTINYGVQTIDSSAFTDMKITSLVVPNSVTSIGSGAFKGCNSLTEITLPFVGRSRSVTSYMGSDSYAQYKFGYIFGYSYSNSSGTVYQDSSTYCYIPASLTRVTITDATGISARAFYNCTNLTSITINSGVQGNVGSDAFKSCHATVTYN